MTGAKGPVALRVVFTGMVCGGLSTGAAQVGEVQLAAQDCTYVVRCAFSTVCGRDSVLAVLFSHEHIQRYSRKTNITIEKVLEMADTNVIRYTYNYVVATLGLTLRRKLAADEGVLTFHLTHSERSNALVPMVLNASGEYRLRYEGGKVAVDYRQEATFNRPVRWLYRKVIAAETERFCREQARHLDEVAGAKAP